MAGMTGKACATCDGTGCPCMRWRDWQSMEQGCHEGCPECGLNSCGPIERALEHVCCPACVRVAELLAVEEPAKRNDPLYNKLAGRCCCRADPPVFAQSEGEG